MIRCVYQSAFTSIRYVAGSSGNGCTSPTVAALPPSNMAKTSDTLRSPPNALREATITAAGLFVAASAP